MTDYNIFCDESCHLEHDQIPVMVLGAVWCPKAISKKIGRDIRAIKVKHGLKPDFEIKWTKVSPAKQDFYLELVDYFFANPDLNFRGLVIPDKSILDHKQFKQDHNIFYYKMFYYVFRNILDTQHHYNIYLDIKDSLGRERLDVLCDVLRNHYRDNQQKLIGNMQHVHSHEIEQLQLADLLIGALAYLHRGLAGNAGKQAIIDKIRTTTGQSLQHNSLLAEQKFNVFIWEPREGA